MANQGHHVLTASFERKLDERQRTQHVRQKTRSMADSAFSLERLLCDPEMGRFPASPVQRALCRAADGLPVHFEPPPKYVGSAQAYHERAMKFHFGCAELPPVRPRVVILETGVRAAKSLIAAIALARSVITCTFRRPPEEGELPGHDGLVGVREGELVRAPIIAPKLDLSEASFTHLKSTCLLSPILSTMTVRPLTHSLTLRRPDGREVLVNRVAASEGGAGVRSTWLAGALFDEADFHGGADAAVNLNEQIEAARTRLLPGAQIWVVSSPWNDSTPFHELVVKSFGFPSADTLCFHSDSRSMNPTLSKADEAAERRKNPENAAREYDAIPLPSSSARFLPEDALTKSVHNVDPNRPTILPPLPGIRHYAGADWGFAKNSSAIAIARTEGRVARLAYFEELRPTPKESLKPKAVVRKFATVGMDYAARTIRSDPYLGTTILEDEFQEFAASFPDAFDRGRVPARELWNPDRDAQVELFTELRRRMQLGLIDLPDDIRLLSQFRGITSEPMAGGSTRIVMPKQGLAHGDLAIAVALALVACPCVEEAVAPPARPTRVHANPYTEFCGGREDEGGPRGGFDEFCGSSEMG